MIGICHLNTNTELIYFSAYMRSGGDASYSGKVNLDTIIDNIGGGTYSNGYYTCPTSGIYQETWTFFSNAGDERRFAVFWKHGDTEKYDMVRTGYAGSLTAIWKCEKGDQLAIGACPGYSVHFYRAENHNRYMITKLRNL